MGNPFLYGQALTPTSLEVQSASPPSIIQAIGRQHIVYELRLTNWGKDSVAINGLSVYDQSNPQREVSSSTKEEVLRKSYAPNLRTGQNRMDRFSLAPGGSGIIYQWLTVPPSYAVPNSLIHTFDLESNTVIDTLTVSIQLQEHGQPSAIQVPVDKGTWVSVRGPSNGSGHRRSFHVHQGKRRASERFAIDWVKLSEDGYLYKGDPAYIQNWFSFGQPVQMVATGTVVHVINGLPDEQPLSLLKQEKLFTLDTVLGNTVVVDIGDGQYVVYAHLKEGSIQVEKGDVLQEGEVIGHIGNSGHSLAPHLHFHIEDQPTPLTGKAIPFHIKAFTLVGKLDSLPNALRGAAWVPDSGRPPRHIKDEIPLENMVIRVID